MINKYKFKTFHGVAFDIYATTYEEVLIELHRRNVVDYILVDTEYNTINYIYTIHIKHIQLYPKDLIFSCEDSFEISCNKPYTEEELRSKVIEIMIKSVSAKYPGFEFIISELDFTWKVKENERDS